MSGHPEPTYRLGTTGYDDEICTLLREHYTENRALTAV